MSEPMSTSTDTAPGWRGWPWAVRGGYDNALAYALSRERTSPCTR